MSIVEIKVGEQVLARHIPADAAWNGGLNFFSPDGDFQQVGTWVYSAGKKLAAHAHNTVAREVLWTQEVLYVRRGRLRAEIYDTEDRKVAELVAGPGDILVLLTGGHGYEILGEGTEVLEIKNGPYLGADLDRRRL
jgi:hypothetical protein